MQNNGDNRDNENNTKNIDNVNKDNTTRNVTYGKNMKYSKMALKAKNRNFSIIVGVLSSFVVFFGALILLYVNRDNIYNLLSKNGENSQNVLYNNVVTPTENTEDTTEGIFAVITSINTEETTKITETTAVETDTSTTAAPDTTSETAANITAAPTQPVTINYGDVPVDDFLQNMIDNAVEIPGTLNKVELPPPGRSMDLQSKIVPLVSSSEIPEPYGYFKNIIFLGDSVTSGFDLYKSVIKFDGENVLQDSHVVAVASYGVYNATRELSGKSIHPLYDGKQMRPEDIIAQIDAKYVFICLGLNDLTWASDDDFLTYYKQLTDNIKSKNPDKIIVVMSVTPVIPESGPGKLDNDKIMDANNALIQFAADNNLMFIDYGAALRNNQNALYADLSSDGYCHIKPSAYDRLVEYLLYHPVPDAKTDSTVSTVN
ncbi:MAG: GDSL-type esterase/lipase family protein [Oscillospiraceae bacterium]|nr:GDSL-type esterase/lipase family protein [Oscillospiraceae bacterium]